MNKERMWKVMITFDKKRPLYRVYRNVDGERKETATWYCTRSARHRTLRTS